jgi:hypothetical protein
MMAYHQQTGKKSSELSYYEFYYEFPYLLLSTCAFYTGCLTVLLLFRHIEQFWEALHMMSPQDLSQLINFCSGRLRLPSSAADFPMPFRITPPPVKSVEHPDEYLPIAQTCFFSLSLPKYSSTIVSLTPDI